MSTGQESSLNGGGDPISHLSAQLNTIKIAEENRGSHRRVLKTHEIPATNNNSYSENGSSFFGGTNSPINFSSDEKRRPIIHNKLYCEQIRVKTSGIKANPNSSSATKVLLKLGSDDLKSVKSHTELAQTANGVRMLARNLAKATIQLDVRAIMIVTKARDNSLIYLTREVAEWLLTREREIVVYVDGNLAKLKRFDAEGLIKTTPRAETYLKYWDRKFAFRNPENFDLVVTLGGDGTVLYVSNLFQRVVPPVISFSLGSLGFLTNFKFDQFREKMSQAVDAGVRAYLRMRFTCRVHRANGQLVCEQQVLNELVVDRGPSPYVTNLELYGDGSLLTIAQADGLIIATPTGSTAYSLSAGGSLVHPGVSAISVTPICPHTLSFRPILLPDGMLLKVKVPETSRSTAWASFDGKVRTELNKGDYVTIQASPFPFPTVISSKTDYIDSVSRNLNWNVREAQKPFTSLLKKKKTSKRIDGDGVGDISGQPHIDEEEEEEEDDDEFDINTNEDDDDEAQQLEEEAYETWSSSLISDEEQSPYLPEIGSGISTPPTHTHSYNMDDRTCFAHPNAKITLRD